MILSRTLARRRIAAGVRPGWAGAWLPVAFDFACLLLVLGLLWGPFRDGTAALQFPVWASALTLFLLGFIPMQGVLILSSLWAAKSRWIDEDGNKA